MSKVDKDQTPPDYINFNDDSYTTPEGEQQTGSEKLITEGEELSDGSKKPEKPFGLSDIPLGVWMIIMVEIFERFSFYSLRSQLVLFFEEALGMEEDWAKALYSYFSSLSYFMPLAGSFLADAVLGRFLTITVCTFVYAIGAYILVFAAIKKSKLFTYFALLLVAMGTGAIKPNVNVFGAQSLKTDNPAAVSAYFSIFYASINLGSVAATLGLPMVKEKYGFATAFAFPAIGLTIALVIFTSGYSRYVHIPPSSSLYKRMIDLFLGANRGKKFISKYNQNLDQEIIEKVLTAKISRSQQDLTPSDDLTGIYSPPQIDSVNSAIADSIDLTTTSSSSSSSPSLSTTITNTEQIRKITWLDHAKVYFKAEHVEQLHQVLNVLPVFPFIVAFFLCFNQTSSTFLLQAKKMDRVVFGYTVLAPQVTALNAVSILILVPTFDRIIYPFLRRTFGMPLKHLNRVLFGLLLTALSFCFSAYIEYKIEYNVAHDLPKMSIVWQIPQYLLISLAELFISVCGIEFVYSQAPRAFKSTLSSFWSLCSAVGDLIAGLLFTFVHLPHLWQFSLLCSGLVMVTFVGFIPIVLMFNKKTEKFYDRIQKEFLQPGSTPPLPVEIDIPFAPLTEYESVEQFWNNGEQAPEEFNQIFEQHKQETAYSNGYSA